MKLTEHPTTSSQLSDLMWHRSRGGPKKVKVILENAVKWELYVHTVALKSNGRCNT